MKIRDTVIEHTDMRSAKVKRHWIVPGDAPKSVEDLSFVSRGPEKSLNWFSVTDPNTDYWGVHRMLGRAYAFELLDLIHNSQATEVPRHALAHIANGVFRHRLTSRSDGLMEGFFSVLSEYLITGAVDR